jgi:hydrogenase expression/formation protein HypD
LKAKADGADVRMVYSPLDALAIARANPHREVIFFGLGFETTMPSTAMTVLQAHAGHIENFSLFCNHITIIPTLKAILDSPDLRLDGFLGPGHVSMVIGTRVYRFIAEQYRRPITVAGFEPLDVLHSVFMVLRQIAEGRCEVENQYARVVPEDGNAQALSAIQQVFELREFFEWRGLGSIEHSGVRIRDTLCRVRCRAQVSCSQPAVRRSAGVPVRRGPERCHQAASVQGVWHCVHARQATWR